jgi:ATP-binding cassette, subfamily A (ABC1), member 3
LYDAREPTKQPFWKFGKKRETGNAPSIPDDMAISVRNLRKTFNTGFFKRSGNIVAIDDLSFDVPKNGIFVLLGSNGYVDTNMCICLSNSEIVAPESQPLYQS